MSDGLKGLPRYNVNNNQQPRHTNSSPTETNPLRPSAMVGLVEGMVSEVQPFGPVLCSILCNFSPALPTLWTILATELSVVLTLCIWKYPGVLHGSLTTGHGEVFLGITILLPQSRSPCWKENSAHIVKYLRIAACLLGQPE